MSHNKLNIIIAGGGTGGHLFPGIAIARAFQKRNIETEVLFVSTGNQFEVSALDKAGYELKTITSSGVKGLGIISKIKALFKVPKGVIESAFIIGSFKPDIVVGVGGYASLPLIIAAWLMRRKIVLHEQNILPGISNRVLSKFAMKVFISFENTRPGFCEDKIICSGNPVRDEILMCSEKQENPDMPFTILIVGGSQGAQSINRAVTDALPHLKDLKSYRFIHQTGSDNYQIVSDSYKSLDIDCTVQPFFHDMHKQYEEADLVICRAGATTIAEITAMGKAVIFIPFPFAADNHQVLNAETLSDKGAAEMITEDKLTGKVLAKRIIHFTENIESLHLMAKKSKSFGKLEAAETIIDACYGLL